MYTYLGFADESERNGVETQLLLVDGFVPPVAEKNGRVVVVVEWLILTVRQLHDDGPIQPCGSLHSEMSMPEICPCLMYRDSQQQHSTVHTQQELLLISYQSDLLAAACKHDFANSTAVDVMIFSCLLSFLMRLGGKLALASCCRHARRKTYPIDDERVGESLSRVDGALRHGRGTIIVRSSHLQQCNAMDHKIISSRLAASSSSLSYVSRFLQIPPASCF